MRVVGGVGRRHAAWPWGESGAELANANAHLFAVRFFGFGYPVRRCSPLVLSSESHLLPIRENCKKTVEPSNSCIDEWLARFAVYTIHRCQITQSSHRSSRPAPARRRPCCAVCAHMCAQHIHGFILYRDRRSNCDVYATCVPHCRRLRGANDGSASDASTQHIHTMIHTDRSTHTGSRAQMLACPMVGYHKSAGARHDDRSQPPTAQLPNLIVSMTTSTGSQRSRRGCCARADWPPPRTPTATSQCTQTCSA